LTAKIPTSSLTPVITVDQLAYAYNKQAPSFVLPKWQIEKGQRIFLHGPSGAGKTTLLNLLAGILVPQQGTIHLLDKPFSTCRDSQRDKLRAQHIGVVFQQFNLIAHLSVLDNIRLAAYFAKQGKQVDEHAFDLLHKLQLPDNIASQSASSLSIGQQQRVAIARALINAPELLLVDEPTSALDANARDAFMSLLLNLCEAHNTTVIFVSHDPQLASYFSQKVALQELVTIKEPNHVV